MTEITFLDDVYVEFIDKMGDDKSILQAARVSTTGSNDVDDDALFRKAEDLYAQEIGSEWFEALDSEGREKVSQGILRKLLLERDKKDQGLINMLMRDRHGSPFEHAVIKVYVKAPIFVFREWHRHRIASYNEMSGRYTKLNPEFYLPKEDRPLLQIGKPGAYTFLPGTEGQKADVHYKLVDIAEQAWAAYEHLLEADVAKEVSRAVLPVSIYSQMYCTMNLRALMNFLSLRTKTKENSAVPSFPQHEISLGADKLEEIFKNNFPWTHEAWEANGRLAP